MSAWLCVLAYVVFGCLGDDLKDRDGILLDLSL
jgi:hypothetical protein